MRLNFVERALMNNPLRAVIQRRVEARALLRLGGRLAGGRALEVGCGRGVGCELILDRFGADRVDAFDLDPRMVALARRRLRGRARLLVASADAIPARAGSYDAVFDFGVLHHVPDWRAALREIRRVLRPGGRLYAEEVCAGLLGRPLARRLFVHPREGRFDHSGFLRALAEEGFRLVGSRAWGRWFGWYVADRA